MKSLIILFIAAFTVVTIAHATPASVRHSSPNVKKTVVKKSVAKGPKNVKTKAKSTVFTKKYKVRSGDNLYIIARRTGMKLTDLQRLNGLQGSRLKIGQTLLVSGKAKKSGIVQADEIVEESGQLISRIALPNDDGLFADSLAAVGVEPVARTYLAIPYRYGAQSRKSTDCSGFVQQVFREFDIQLPRTAREQYQVGKKVDRSGLSSGDLLFFRTRARKNYPTHVGIYLGNGKMIHASSRQHKVVISDVNHPYYVKRYVGAKRTATFLPGEIDLEMLARQVTVSDVDVSLAAAITADVDDLMEGAQVMEASLQTGVVLEAGYDDRSDGAADDVEDIDTDVEPEPDVIIPAPPMLGSLPLSDVQPAIEVASNRNISAEATALANDYLDTTVSTAPQTQR